MTVDPNSQLFKDAIAITGRAYLPSHFVSGCRDELEFRDSKWHWCIYRSPTARLGVEEEQLTLGTWPISQSEAECIYEHHFRVWLERESQRRGEDVMVYAPDRFTKREGYAIWWSRKMVAHADTYLECQMMAVVEIDKQAKGAK